MKTILSTHGTVYFVWTNGAKVQTELGMVYVPARMLCKDFVWGARVRLKVISSDGRGGNRASFVAEEVVCVLPPLPIVPVECYGRVKWFNGRKRRGYVSLIDHPSGGDAYLDGKVCPSLRPQKGDYVRVMVEETMRGLRIMAAPSFGDRITSVAKALEEKPAPTGDSVRVVVSPSGEACVAAGLIPVLPQRLS